MTVRVKLIKSKILLQIRKGISFLFLVFDFRSYQRKKLREEGFLLFAFVVNYLRMTTPFDCAFPFLSTSVKQTEVPSFPQTAHIQTIEPTKKNICAHESCKRKLQLSAVACRCGKRFCSTHSYFVDHSCQYDYRNTSSTILQKQLVKCVNDKLENKI